jgi:hypothetical protein
MVNTMSSAYAYVLSCSLPIFMPPGTIFIPCITFCNAKLNNIGDSHTVLFLFYFQRKMTMHQQKMAFEYCEPAWDPQQLTNRRAQMYGRLVVSILTTNMYVFAGQAVVYSTRPKMFSTN